VKGIYVADELDNLPKIPNAHLSGALLSQPASLEQWHRRLTHCSPLTIKQMSTGNLVDGLNISDTDLHGKCEDCVIGQQVRRPFNGFTKKGLDPLELVSFDLWEPSQVQSAGGKVYFMPIVDGGLSYKYGAYLSDKSDSSTIAAFDAFRATTEVLLGHKVCHIRTDQAYDTSAWREYC